jgi:DNA-binding transcriptional regulator YhcF (GntR family)
MTAAPRLPGGWHLRPVSETFPHIRTPWKAIAAELRYALEHDMQPGEPVPSLREMAGMYEVAPAAAHKALRQLAAEGLIERVPGRPYRIPSTPKAG